MRNVSRMCCTEQVIRCAIKFLLSTPLTFGRILANIYTVFSFKRVFSAEKRGVKVLLAGFWA